MAIAYTSQKATNSVAFGTTVSITVPSGGFTAGNKLICVWMTGDASSFASAMADSAGNTYTRLHTYSPGARSLALFVGELASGLTAGQSVTATQTDGGFLSVFEFSGLDTGTAFDVQTQNNEFNNVWGSAGFGPLSLTPSQADTLLIGTTLGESTTATLTPDSPWIELDETDNIFSICNLSTSYRIVSSISAYTYTGVLTGTVSNMSIFDAFKASSGLVPVTQGITRPHGLPRKVNDEAPFLYRPWIS